MIPDRLQHFLEHFWNDQTCDKMWTPGEKNMGASLKHILVSYLRIWNSEKWKVCVPNFLKLRNLETLKVWKTDNLAITKVEILKFTNSTHLSLAIWNFENCKLDFLNLCDLKIPNTPHDWRPLLAFRFYALVFSCFSSYMFVNFTVLYVRLVNDRNPSINCVNRLLLAWIGS